jgi:hypothetical protein
MPARKSPMAKMAENQNLREEFDRWAESGREGLG